MLVRVTRSRWLCKSLENAWKRGRVGQSQVTIYVKTGNYNPDTKTDESYNDPVDQAWEWVGEQQTRLP